MNPNVCPRCGNYMIFRFAPYGRGAYWYCETCKRSPEVSYSNKTEVST